MLVGRLVVFLFASQVIAVGSWVKFWVNLSLLPATSCNQASQSSLHTLANGPRILLTLLSQLELLVQLVLLAQSH